MRGVRSFVRAVVNIDIVYIMVLEDDLHRLEVLLHVMLHIVALRVVETLGAAIV